MTSSKQATIKTTTTKEITKVLTHRRLSYINNKDLDKLLKISINLKLDKNSLKLGFYKLCTVMIRDSRLGDVRQEHMIQRFGG